MLLLPTATTIATIATIAAAAFAAAVNNIFSITTNHIIATPSVFINKLLLFVFTLTILMIAMITIAIGAAFDIAINATGVAISIAPSLMVLIINVL